MTYLFGYGSLISTNSRSKTGITSQATPCIIQGYKRSWTQPIPSDKVLALEVIAMANFSCNGVLIPINDSELVNFDLREKGYLRVKVDINSIETNLQLSENDTVWIYVNNKQADIKASYRIIQSYVDVILSGCLEYGESFAIDFINTTHQWDQPWINDRLSPIYPRAIKLSQKQKNLIDRILHKNIQISH